jgi:hypothetical protein
MVHPMKVNTNKERSMEEESLHGLIIVLLLAISMIIIFMVTVFMNGQMEECTLAIGKIIKWKVMAPLHGLMVESM